MKGEADTAAKQERPGINRTPALFIVLCGFSLIFVICVTAVIFYRSLESEIYTERATYLEEISEQIIVTIDTISDEQWDLAAVFGKLLQEETIRNRSELRKRIAWAESVYGQQGLILLAFDDQGDYYDAVGNRARWSGSQAVIDGEAPERQLEITTLPTSILTNDQMVFVLQMRQPVRLEESGEQLTHVAVVRDMAVFHETFQVPFFSGHGENYIISNTGTRIYREQSSSAVIGDVFNILKPMEAMEFRYNGSCDTLRRAVAEGERCSLEFADSEGRRYYVTSSPMKENRWSLLSIVPSEIVSAGMQHFMQITVAGMGGIALVVMAAFALILVLIARYRAGQLRIRQQSEVNAALQEAAWAAQEASRAKTVFLTHMSHDIRTPINGIMGMADIAIRNRNDQERVADCLKKITTASRHLLGLVNDVLDMSRIESGKVQLEDKPFNIISLLDGCGSVVDGQALKRNLTLKTDFSGVTQSLLRGDELHLRQILINILGNAVKFTPEGGKITFTAVDEVKEGKAALTIVIGDNGIGISEEFQNRIFEPFSQEEDGSRSSYQGTGLGMSIVKQLLELMGGSIELQSAPGQGSVFTVHLCLPIETAPTKTRQTENMGEDLTGLRVMLAEDNELNMEIARYILEECNIVVTPAWNGREALKLFMEKPAGSYDLILMDVMMPVMGGLEATRAIRNSGRSDALTVPIVAMTANAYEEDRRAALEAGMNLHLAKPVEREELIRVLCELGGKKTAGTDASGREETV